MLQLNKIKDLQGVCCVSKVDCNIVTVSYARDQKTIGSPRGGSQHHTLPRNPHTGESQQTQEATIQLAMALVPPL